MLPKVIPTLKVVGGQASMIVGRVIHRSEDLRKCRWFCLYFALLFSLPSFCFQVVSCSSWSFFPALVFEMQWRQTYVIRIRSEQEHKKLERYETQGSKGRREKNETKTELSEQNRVWEERSRECIRRSIRGRIMLRSLVLLVLFLFLLWFLRRLLLLPLVLFPCLLLKTSRVSCLSIVFLLILCLHPCLDCVKYTLEVPLSSQWYTRYRIQQ